MEEGWDDMSITRTFINKLGDDKDKFDTKAYAKDSTSKNFEEDYGFVPKSENDKLLARRESSMKLMDEYKRIGLEKLEKPKAEKKSKREINIIDIEGEGPYRYKKGFQGDMATDGTDIKELKKLATLKNKAASEVRANLAAKAKHKEKLDFRIADKIIKDASRDVAKEKSKLTQKLRADRLAKKELRVQEYKDRLRRLRNADRMQAKVQRRLSQVLNRRRKEQMLTQGEVKAMYGRENTQNDGILLHARDPFFSNDGRETSVKTNSNILNAQNLLLRTSPKGPKQKWF